MCACFPLIAVQRGLGLCRVKVCYPLCVAVHLTGTHSQMKTKFYCLISAHTIYNNFFHRAVEFESDWSEGLQVNRN